jgi:hypothetical protein
LPPKLYLNSAILLLVLVAGCGGDENHAGMGKDEAERFVLARAHEAGMVKRFPYPTDAVKTKTPRGVDAWLVKLKFQGHSGEVCAYAWRDNQDKIHEGTWDGAHIEWDGACRHWNY